MKTLMKALLTCMLFLLLFGVNVTAYATSPADPEIGYQYAVSNENIIQSSLDEKKPTAESIFGWKETGEKYKLSEYYILVLEIDGVVQKMIVKREVMICNIVNAQGLIYETKLWLWYHDFVTGEVICRMFKDEPNSLSADYQYFNEGQEVRFISCDGISLYIEDLPEEQFNKIINGLDEEKTLEEVAQFLLLIDSDTNNWFNNLKGS
jgi:hypothetical protein